MRVAFGVGRLTLRPAVRAFAPTSAVRAFSTPAPVDEIDEAVVIADMKKTLADSKKTVTPWAQRMITLPAQHLPENLAEVGHLEPAMPAKQRGRTVIISQKAKSSMTSGQSATHPWHIQWQHEHRWGNGLMGWTSTADPMSNVDLKFESIEDATFFCEKHGYKYDVQETPVTDEVFDKPGSQKYAHNFLPRRFEAVLTKYGKGKNAKAIFTHANGENRSHYFRPLKYHGDKETEQFGPNPDSGYGAVSPKAAATK